MKNMVISHGPEVNDFVSNFCTMHYQTNIPAGISCHALTHIVFQVLFAASAKTCDANNNPCAHAESSFFQKAKLAKNFISFRLQTRTGPAGQLHIFKLE